MDALGVASAKDDLRQRIWKRMDQTGVSRFPTPVVGRIPNFQGADHASERVTRLRGFQRANVVKVNPDAPQHGVRRLVLSEGKRLLMPSPRLRKGFLVVDPKALSGVDLQRAATIRGAFQYGTSTELDQLPPVDFIVAGSVAVARNGARVGKGGGYSELEYGILRTLGLVREATPIVTSVHDLQLVEWVPREDHDFLVDAIVTPTQTITVRRGDRQPEGLIWAQITPHMLDRMPILKELKHRIPSPEG